MVAGAIDPESKPPHATTVAIFHAPDLHNAAAVDDFVDAGVVVEIVAGTAAAAVAVGTVAGIVAGTVAGTAAVAAGVHPCAGEVEGNSFCSHNLAKHHHRCRRRRQQMPPTVLSACPRKMRYSCCCEGRSVVDEACP